MPLIGFTTKDYIESNKLGVRDGDTRGYRMVAEHLRRKGYDLVRQRVTGEKEKRIWVKISRKPDREKLAARLKELE